MSPKRILLKKFKIAIQNFKLQLLIFNFELLTKTSIPYLLPLFQKHFL